MRVERRAVNEELQKPTGMITSNVIVTSLPVVLSGARATRAPKAEWHDHLKRDRHIVAVRVKRRAGTEELQKPKGMITSTVIVTSLPCVLSGARAMKSSNSRRDDHIKRDRHIVAVRVERRAGNEERQKPKGMIA